MTDQEIQVKILEIEKKLNAAVPKGEEWELKTNRHPECSGEAWGWIKGPCENWCWTDKRPSSRNDAVFVANAPSDMRFLVAEVKRLKAELAESKRRERAAINDMTHIHCAGRRGCAICLNNDVCKEQNIHIGECADFDWRGPAEEERE